MGAWGSGHIENDTAGDWVWELEKATDLSVIESAVNAVFEDDYVDSDIASEALAAIEAIARLRGNWGERDSYTESMDKWVDAHKNLEVPAALIQNAKNAIDKIIGEKSELDELWSESEKYDQWKKGVEALKSRISA